MNEIKNISIIGLGLIGGSIAKSLKSSEANYIISGFDKPEILNKAINENVIDFALSEINETLNSDLIFLCTPVDVSISIFESIAEKLKPNTILTDVCGVKYPFQKIWDKKGKNGYYIGGHPMTGKEVGGYDNSDSLLFENCVYILSEDLNNNNELVEFRKVIENFRANILFVPPKQHDLIAASVSHLPQLVSVALVNTASLKTDYYNFLDLAAGGFRDMTRIASSDFDIWKPVIKENKNEILTALEKFKYELDKLSNLISDNKIDEISDYFETARKYRDEIPQNTKGFLKQLFDLYVFVKDEPGSVSKISTTLFENNINIKDIELLKIREGSGGTFRLSFDSESDSFRAKEILENKGFITKKFSSIKIKVTMKSIIILLLFISSNIFSENKIDSLNQLLNNSNNIDKVNVSIELANEYLKAYPRKSIVIAIDAIKIAEDLKFKSQLYKLYSTVGKSYRVLGDFNESLEYYLKALDLAKKEKNNLQMAEAKNNIGNVYNYLGDFDTALKQYQIALQLREDEKDSLAIAKSLNNIGNIYKNKSNLDQSLTYLKKSLDIKKRFSSDRETVSTLKNIGSVYSLLGKLKEAINYYNKALDIDVKLNDSLGIANSYYGIAEAYFNNNKYKDAEKFAEKAFLTSKRFRSNFITMRSSYLLFNINQKIGNLSKAQKYDAEYWKVRQQIYNEQLEKQTIELKSIYDLREKDNEIFELELNKQKLQRNILIIISVILVGGIFVFVIFYREKIKNSKNIAKKNVELKSAIEKAKKANLMKSEFLAQMSHEIRTPINTIMNYNSLLKLEFNEKLDAELKGSFDSIESAAKRLLRTIDLILNMSDIESGTYEIILQKFNVFKEILEPIYKEFNSSCLAKDLKLTLTNNLKDQLIIEIDGYTISQILANLVDNAIKYTKSGEIEIILYNEENINKIDIKDSGIGISEKYLPKLFSKFSQEEQGYTRKFEGTGLGLSLVKKYCELNNLSIDVKSKKGEGTTFTIIFNENQIIS